MELPETYTDRLKQENNLSAALYRSNVVVRLLEELSITSDAKILDIGCGAGVTLHELKKRGYSYLSGADYLDNCVAGIRKEGFRGYTIDLNKKDTGLPSEKFDVITMLEVLEHLYDPAEVLNRIRGMLKENGVLIVSVPNEYNIRRRLSVMIGKEIGSPTLVGGHIKFFTYPRFVKFVADQDYKIVRSFGTGAGRLSRNALGRTLMNRRPDLFARWTFVIARPV